MAAALAKIFGSGKKGEPPSPQQAIQKLRETEEMLSKKTDFLEKKIDNQMKTIRKSGMKNKRGDALPIETIDYVVCIINPLAVARMGVVLLVFFTHNTFLRSSCIPSRNTI